MNDRCTKALLQNWKTMFGAKKNLADERLRGKCFDLEASIMIHHTHSKYPTVYLLLRYQLNASCCVSAGNGVGTSDKPGLATGCLKYTAEQIL